MTPRKSSALETIAMVNRHGLMLLWLKDLINVTEKLQFIDPTILLYTQKGPLVAVFRSPLMKVLDNSDLNVSSMNCNFSVTLIKSLNQSSIKPCLTVHLVAM